MAVKVTFDSNVWESLTTESRLTDLQRKSDVRTVCEQLRSETVNGFISDTAFSLEAIPRKSRSRFLSDRVDSIIKTEWSSDKDGQDSMRLEIGGFRSSHPGLSAVLEDRLKIALQDLKMKILPGTRIGKILPPGILEVKTYTAKLPANYKDDYMALCETISEYIRKIENRGAGRAQLQRISNQIRLRNQLPEMAWFDYFEYANTNEQELQIIKGFSEWADGDNVALHLAYQNDILCTGDFGKSNIDSIFSAQNREWLATEFNIKIMTLHELVAYLERKN